METGVALLQLLVEVVIFYDTYYWILEITLASESGLSLERIALLHCITIRVVGVQIVTEISLSLHHNDHMK